MIRVADYIAIIAGLALIAAPLAARAEAPPFAEVMQPFLQQHCVACHGPEEQEALIRYDTIAAYRLEDEHLWTKVYEKLSAGEMPPEGEPQPSAAETKRVLDWIEQSAKQAQRAVGAGQMRRLNRRELSAALQDLTGLDVNFAAALPGDGTINGFDTGAEGLQDAADSVAQIMSVTRRAVDGIYFIERPESRRFVADLRDAKDGRAAFDPWKAHGAKPDAKGKIRPGEGLLIEPQWVGDRGGIEFKIPPPPDECGVLSLRLVVAVFKPMKGIPNPHLWVQIGAQDVDFREINASPNEPQTLEYQVQVDDLAIEPGGIVVSLSNKVEVPYGIDGFENDDRDKGDEIPGGMGLFRPNFKDKNLPLEERPVPFIVLQSIEIEPDYIASWPPAGWQSDVGEVRDETASAKQLLALWMHRAWRRPVSDAEQERYIAHYENLRKQDLPFDEALRATFQSALLAAPFRYLPPIADANEEIAQHAIASRLAFMLWGAPPDGELRRLATAGKLRKPDVLDAQVDRLLDDPRSDAFVRPLVTQWLEMEQPITIAMDHIEKQDFRFGRNLKASMREETIVYVARMFAVNRPATEIVQSDWTMMNEILARHYDYDGIEGGSLRYVKLRGEDPRGGGIISHAGIQSMLCWMGENWVIYRGTWMLRHILDDPPPPPPLDVPELVPSDGANRGKSFRELLVQHQQDSKCSVCHKGIDPLGFALQNFDLSGRWREVEFERYKTAELDGKIEWRGEGETRPVDATGKLPRGEEFKNFAECKQTIVEHYAGDVVRGLLKNLTLYATGRQPGVAEMIQIKRISQQHTNRGYPLRDLLKSLIRSEVFLQRAMED